MKYENPEIGQIAFGNPYKEYDADDFNEQLGAMSELATFPGLF